MYLPLCETNTTQRTDGFSKDADEYDSDDLEKAFGNKPEQLASLKKNCQTIWHPERDCRVYMVSKLKSHSGYMNTQSEEKKRTLSQVEDKARKATKVTKEEKKAEEERKGKVLTKPQTKKLEKLKEKMSEDTEQVHEMQKKLESSGELRAFIPHAIMQDWESRSGSIVAETLAVDLPLSKGWTGNFEAAFEQANGAHEDFTASVARMRNFIGEFNKFTGQDV